MNTDTGPTGQKQDTRPTGQDGSGQTQDGRADRPETTRSPGNPEGQVGSPDRPTSGRPESPATPAFMTPNTSPAAATPVRPTAGRASARRQVNFNLGQGETQTEVENEAGPGPQAAVQPPERQEPPRSPQPQAATQPAGPQVVAQPPRQEAGPAARDRPRRATRQPAWTVDFDMSAEASEVSSCAENGNNGLVGMYGGSKDDRGWQLKKALATLAALVAEARNVVAAIVNEEVARDL